MKKTLYGLCQIPRAFYQYITNNLEQIGMNNSNFDPCIFVSEKVTCIVYVEDLIFWAKNEDNIHNLAINVQELGVYLEQEDDSEGLLIVTLEQ